ncbi:trimeric intracellular cation channel family protein [Vibrio rotiferianus]|uniref:trimeric intracellular cation channel family protein n=1 Tax=Vibrio rotiferianus TaxID=190895 RepID=UPI000B5A1BC2|nr:trimeric intracellular cation channel family protein [Vibrio rotiferianus]ASI93680.1 hypothetical protein BSZ04_01255 [Vibrio rotiferianus]
MSLIYIFDIFGTAVFAISGVLVASKFRMDAFGAVVLGSLTAIGGGTVRDMAIGATPVFWMIDSVYLWVILVTCITTIIAIRRQKYIPNWVLSLADAIGLAVFVGIGFEKAMQYQGSYTVAIIMGVITGCGGGILRDALTGEVPSVLQKEIYATSCLIGGMVYTAFLNLGISNTKAFFLCVITVLVSRLISINYNLSLPQVLMSKVND